MIKTIFNQSIGLEILMLLLFVCLGCKNNKNYKSNLKERCKNRKLELSLESNKAEKEKYLNLISFLKNPIDLHRFKKTKNRNLTTTTVSNKMNYWFTPRINNSIYYTYNYLIKNFSYSKRINQIIVFKHGVNKHNYEDETEILIELRIFNKDKNLGKANLIELTKNELELKFGTSYLTVKNRMVYFDKNKILILELEGFKVKSYQYIKLNTNKIDVSLIKKIIQ